ncbi:hypothetical protein [Aeoliella sp. SH292]|uniref:hypothetical protein n=1 Tax=Aeoliella sp. SH292 TaxID=3454464 RepID=UPI003F9EA94C
MSLQWRVLAGFVLIASGYVGCESVFAIDIPIPNGSFESTVVPATSETGHMGRWTFSRASAGQVGTYAPDPPLAGQVGNSVGRIFVNSGGTASTRATIYQDATIIREGIYDVSVLVAHQPGQEPSTSPFYLNFESFGFGGAKILLGENINPVGTFSSDSFTQYSAQVEIASGHPAIGQYLRMVFNNQSQDGGTTGTGAAYNLDDVQLKYTPTGGEQRSLGVWQASFETEVWTSTMSGHGSAGYYRPQTPLAGTQDGDQLGFVSVRSVSTDTNSVGALYQDVAAILPGTYTWNVAAAMEAGFEATTTPLKLNVEVIAPGNVKSLLLSHPVPLDALNTTSLTDLEVTFDIPADSPHIGSMLRLVMVAEGKDASSNAVDPRVTYLIDNVRLTLDGPVSLPGDYDNNLMVDDLDYGVWKSSFGQSVTAGTLADGNGDGVVDLADYTIWRDNLGASVAPTLSTNAVPEPSSLLVVALLTSALLAVRKTPC